MISSSREQRDQSLRQRRRDTLNTPLTQINSITTSLDSDLAGLSQTRISSRTSTRLSTPTAELQLSPWTLTQMPLALVSLTVTTSARPVQITTATIKQHAQNGLLTDLTNAVGVAEESEDRCGRHLTIQEQLRQAKHQLKHQLKHQPLLQPVATQCLSREPSRCIHTRWVYLR